MNRKQKQERTLLNVLYRNSFPAFCRRAFREVNPDQEFVEGGAFDALCFRLQNIAEGKAPGRLVINMPPRSLKSFMISVCLPAWLLGRDPTLRIICASYSEELGYKFSRDCRVLMESAFYKEVFPCTRFSPNKVTEREIETTKRGFRLATSVGGTLTGRGGNVLIVDDPIKAIDAGSEAALTTALEWFQNTAITRLDKQGESKILVVMQRLHANDLSGTLLEQGWPSFVLPMIATRDAVYFTGEDETYFRKAGEVLQPKRDSLEAVLELKQRVGSRIFAAQYQQDPTPPDGNTIKAAWLVRYDPKAVQQYDRIVLSCDPAGKAGLRNDYTAIVVFGLRDKNIDILDATRGHWTVMQMQARIEQSAAEWNVDLAIIEDTSSGMGLIQLLRERVSLNVVGRQPKGDKESRMARHEGRFEAGRIFLPHEAPWLAEFESELLAFPYGRYDDQVDAVLLFLDWHAERSFVEVKIPSPISIPNTDYPPGFMERPAFYGYYEPLF